MVADHAQWLSHNSDSAGNFRDLDYRTRFTAGGVHDPSVTAAFGQ